MKTNCRVMTYLSIPLKLIKDCRSRTSLTEEPSILYLWSLQSLTAVYVHRTCDLPAVRQELQPLTVRNEMKSSWWQLIQPLIVRMFWCLDHILNCVTSKCLGFCFVFFLLDQKPRCLPRAAENDITVQLKQNDGGRCSSLLCQAHDVMKLYMVNWINHLKQASQYNVTVPGWAWKKNTEVTVGKRNRFSQIYTWYLRIKTSKMFI